MSEAALIIAVIVAIVFTLSLVVYLRSSKAKRAMPPQEQAPARPAEPVPQRPMPITTAERPKELREALGATRQQFWGRIRGVFTKTAPLTSDEIENLEEILYTSDLGPQTVGRLLEAIQERLQTGELVNADSVREALRSEMLDIFQQSGVGPLSTDEKPTVWMIVGVNGAGKTTTIGKLAFHFAEQGKRVLVAAGDTFRAAAGAQLRAWTERAQVEIFEPKETKDPSAVAYSALQKAIGEKYDLVLVDTAGRLHTAQNLMEELKKMKRVLQKLMPSAPHQILLVLDANSGQNALHQAREFHAALGVTGVVLTKLDGTAKGGVAVGVASELKLPIQLIGVGEKMGDLRDFSPAEFVDSIL